MSAISFPRYAYLAYFSSPAGDRLLYRHVRRTPPRTIVEIGVNDCVRAMRLIELAQIQKSDRPLQYTGIDLFEARPAASPGIQLKQAHRLLTGYGVRVRFVPGGPAEALARTANSLLQVDLLIVGNGVDGESMREAWKFVPRMLHNGSDVFVWETRRENSAAGFRRFSFDVIHELALWAERRDRFAA